MINQRMVHGCPGSVLSARMNIEDGHSKTVPAANHLSTVGAGVNNILAAVNAEWDEATAQVTSGEKQREDAGLNQTLNSKIL